MAVAKIAESLLEALKQNPSAFTDVDQLQTLLQQLLHQHGTELVEELSEYAIDNGVSCCFALLKKMQKKKAAKKKAETSNKPIPLVVKKI